MENSRALPPEDFPPLHCWGGAALGGGCARLLCRGSARPLRRDHRHRSAAEGGGYSAPPLGTPRIVTARWLNESVALKKWLRITARTAMLPPSQQPLTRVSLAAARPASRRGSPHPGPPRGPSSSSPPPPRRQGPAHHEPTNIPISAFLSRIQAGRPTQRPTSAPPLPSPPQPRARLGVARHRLWHRRL